MTEGLGATVALPLAEACGVPLRLTEACKVALALAEACVVPVCVTATLGVASRDGLAVGEAATLGLTAVQAGAPAALKKPDAHGMQAVAGSKYPL